jgi:putative redox protein
MQAEYQGSLRCQLTHEPSGQTQFTDAPVDNHGRGESFSPTDLLASSAASCMMTIMGIKAQEKGWSLEGTRASVEKYMSEDAPRRVVRLVIDVELPAHLDEAQFTIMKRVALACPVLQSLNPAIEIEHRFRQLG